MTVLEHPQHGLFGGYLLLNPAGRPLEFHCTAPIKPNRAQQILYGPTLQPFLYGEQIGRTLLEKSAVQPYFVCTDRPAALAVRDHVAPPVALVITDGAHLDRPHPHQPLSDEAGSSQSPVRQLRIDGPHGDAPDSACAVAAGPRLVTFELGRNRLAVPERAIDDRRVISERFAKLADSFPEPFDLAEPFGRIREAIEEAQQAVRQP